MILEEENIIKKVRVNNDSLTYCYELTKKGSDLLPILKKMSEWGNKYFKDWLKATDFYLVDPI